MNIIIPELDEKPRTNFCWVCSRKFYGDKFVYLTPEDGYSRPCHKMCAEGEVKEHHEDKAIKIGVGL